MALLSMVRAVRTLDGRYPLYENARIWIERVSPETLSPTAKYVLNSHIDRLLCLREKMLTKKVDIFGLTDIYIDGDIIIAPPIVEWSDGKWAIVDGLHRNYIALNLGVDICVVKVAMVAKLYPIISYPVDWIDVVAFDVKPEDPTMLRDLRAGIVDTSRSIRSYYRDYSHLGSNGRRPRKTQTG